MGRAGHAGVGADHSTTSQFVVVILLFHKLLIKRCDRRLNDHSGVGECGIDTPIDIEALLTLNTVIPQVLPALQTFAENMMRDLHGDHDVELDLPCTMP